MKVKLLSTGEITTVNGSYGARLIEQGKAISVMDEKPVPKRSKAEKVKEPQGMPGGDA